LPEAAAREEEAAAITFRITSSALAATVLTLTFKPAATAGLEEAVAVVAATPTATSAALEEPAGSSAATALRVPGAESAAEVEAEAQGLEAPFS